VFDRRSGCFEAKLLRHRDDSVDGLLLPRRSAAPQILQLADGFADSVDAFFDAINSSAWLCMTCRIAVNDSNSSESRCRSAACPLMSSSSCDTSLLSSGACLSVRRADQQRGSR